jgi:ornithine cyclodeaminase/alanine dehydrogenase
MADAIDAIEEACGQQANGQAIFAGRINLPLPNGWIRLMPAALLGSGVLGYKEFHLTRTDSAAAASADVRYTFALIDYRTGQLLALMDASHLTAMRTGAAAGVAVKYLARAEASSVGILGSGGEARTEFEAIAAVRSLREARVFSRSVERREEFAREMSERFGVAVTAVGRPEEVTEGVDILVAATNTAGRGPALLGEWLRGATGLHINSIGSTLPTQREIDPDVWSVAHRVVLDTRKLLEESGDAIAARQAGSLDETKVVELHDVVAGRAAGRTHAAETTLYKSVGTGIQDVAVAYRVFQQARAKGLGHEVADFQSARHVEPN